MKISSNDAFESLLFGGFCFVLFFHFDGCFSSLYLPSYCEFGAKFTVLLLNLCLGLHSTSRRGHFLNF